MARALPSRSGRLVPGGRAGAHLPAIARAVLDQRAVAMRYESWSGIRDWRVEPLGLVLKAGAWYVVARGAGKVRIFKVSNIIGQAVQEERFERPADFDLPVFWSAKCGASRRACGRDAPSSARRRRA